MVQHTVISRKVVTLQSRKVFWDMINTLFLTLYLSNLLLLLSFSNRKHTSVASRAVLWKFFEKQWTKNHPQSLSGLSRALFPTTFLEIAVFPPMMRHVRHPLLNFLLPYCRLCNVLNATCVLVGRYLLDLLEYAHTFLFRPTQSIGLKICVRLFSLRLRTLVLRLHCSSSVWHLQSTLFACMMWGF